MMSLNYVIVIRVIFSLYTAETGETTDAAETSESWKVLSQDTQHTYNTGHHNNSSAVINYYCASIKFNTSI